MSNEEALDLTPAEARAEIEAWLGEGWTVIGPEPDGTEDVGEECYVSAWRGVVGLHAFAPTFRAAVDALKRAWRDAVRPWIHKSVALTAKSAFCVGGGELAWDDTEHELVARVLGEEA